MNLSNFRIVWFSWVLVAIAIGNNRVDAGIVGAWSFDEGTGATVHDSSPEHNDGTISTTSMWTAPGFDGSGGALDFAGYQGDTYVSVPDSNSLDFNGSIYLSAWVKHQDSGNPLDIIIHKGQSSSVYAMGLLNNKITFIGNYQTGGTYFDVQTDESIPMDQWTQIAAWYDMTSIRLYINGTLKKQVPMTVPLINNNEPLFFGIDYPGFVERYAGSLDEVVISTIPEPATGCLALCGGLVAVLGTRGSRRFGIS